MIRSAAQKKAAKNLWISVGATLVAMVGCVVAAAFTNRGTIWHNVLSMGAFLAIPAGLYLILLFGSRMEGH